MNGKTLVCYGDSRQVSAVRPPCRAGLRDRKHPVFRLSEDAVTKSVEAGNQRFSDYPVLAVGGQLRAGAHSDAAS